MPSPPNITPPPPRHCLPSNLLACGEVGLGNLVFIQIVNHWGQLETCLVFYLPIGNRIFNVLYILWSFYYSYNIFIKGFLVYNPFTIIYNHFLMINFSCFLVFKSLLARIIAHHNYNEWLLALFFSEVVLTLTLVGLWYPKPISVRAINYSLEISQLYNKSGERQHFFAALSNYFIPSELMSLLIEYQIYVLVWVPKTNLKQSFALQLFPV